MRWSDYQSQGKGLRNLLLLFFTWEVLFKEMRGRASLILGSKGSYKKAKWGLLCPHLGSRSDVEIKILLWFVHQVFHSCFGSFFFCFNFFLPILHKTVALSLFFFLKDVSVQSLALLIKVAIWNALYETSSSYHMCVYNLHFICK